MLFLKTYIFVLGVYIDALSNWIHVGCYTDTQNMLTSYVIMEIPCKYFNLIKIANLRKNITKFRGKCLVICKKKAMKQCAVNITELSD